MPELEAPLSKSEVVELKASSFNRVMQDVRHERFPCTHLGSKVRWEEDMGGEDLDMEASVIRVGFWNESSFVADGEGNIVR